MPITPPATVPPALETWLDASLNRERSGSYDDVKLEPVQRVLAACDLPAPPRPVTIAGTKGKGSTQAFLDALLRAHGRSTVCFSSPHVRHLSERWRCDGDPADGAELLTAMRRIATAEADAGIQLSYFERCFLLAVLLASRRPQATFLCEVGLGGRLDCANALDADIAICTHLSHDHCQVLGDSLGAIAGEKLAIARPGRPLLIAPQSAAAATAITERLPPRAICEWVAKEFLHGVVGADCRLGLVGDHQLGNAAVALRAAELLLGELDPSRCRQALATTTLPGRCQLHDLGERRLLIDGAHNGPSIAATLLVASRQLRPGWQLAIGVAKDKDLTPILTAINDHNSAMDNPPAVIRRCGYASERARGPEDWPGAPAWPWCADISDALNAAGDDLCITGSFYLAGEALEQLT